MDCDEVGGTSINAITNKQTGKKARAGKQKNERSSSNQAIERETERRTFTYRFEYSCTSL